MTIRIITICAAAIITTAVSASALALSPQRVEVDVKNNSAITAFNYKFQHNNDPLKEPSSNPFNGNGSFAGQEAAGGGRVPPRAFAGTVDLYPYGHSGDANYDCQFELSSPGHAYVTKTPKANYSCTLAKSGSSTFTLTLN